MPCLLLFLCAVTTISLNCSTTEKSTESKSFRFPSHVEILCGNFAEDCVVRSCAHCKSTIEEYLNLDGSRQFPDGFNHSYRSRHCTYRENGQEDHTYENSIMCHMALQADVDVAQAAETDTTQVLFDSVKSYYCPQAEKSTALVKFFGYSIEKPNKFQSW
jgi:hypothetical protein